jgi:peptide/nickel transport system substrate-binding protein
MMMRLTLALLLTAGWLNAAQPVKDPDTYTYLTLSDQDSLDPAYSYDTASHLVIFNVYESLFFYDGSSTEKLIPHLATKVPSRANGLISADGLTYRFPIRKGVKFHDGATLTPEDVRYFLRRFMLFDRDVGPSPLLLEPVLAVTGTRKDGKLCCERSVSPCKKIRSMASEYRRLAKSSTSSRPPCTA